MKRKIVIIGAGALGKCLAAVLADQASVTVYERDLVTSRALTKGLFILKEKRRSQKVKVRVVASLSQLQEDRIDVLIFATKIMDIRKAVAEAEGLSPRCVFFPQNGIFDIHWTDCFLKTAKICRGVTTMACQETGPGQVTLFYRGDVYAGGPGAGRIAVDNISFEVKTGEIFAFLGPNGAGKSTTIKMLTTLLHPTSGEIQLNGNDPVNDPNAVRKSFGIVFQDPSLDDELTAWENLEFHGVLYNIEKKLRRKRIEVYFCT